MQENNFNQLLTLINEIDNFKIFNTVETQLQIVRKKLEKNKEENILKSIKDAFEAAGLDGNINDTLDKVVHKLKSHYGKKTRDLTPKYRNPFNYSETWSGFGHRPQWLKNGLSENKFTLEQCKIKN